MPDWSVTSPDGQTLTVSGDEMPDEQALQDIFAHPDISPSPDSPARAEIPQSLGQLVNQPRFPEKETDPSTQIMAAMAPYVEALEPLTPAGLLNQPARAARAITGDQYADPFQPGQPAIAKVPMPTGTGVAAGIGRVGAGLVNALQTPESLVTLPLAASAPIRAIYAGQMAAELPEQVAQSATTLGNTKSTTAEKVQAALEPAVSAAMIAGLSKGEGATNEKTTQTEEQARTASPAGTGGAEGQRIADSRRADIEQPAGAGQPQVAETGKVLLSPESQAYLDPKQHGIDTPIRVASEIPAGSPMAGQIATIDRSSGQIVVNPEQFESWLKSVPEANRDTAVKSLLSEEQIHLGVDDDSANDYWKSITSAEQAINRRRYTGTWSGKKTAGGAPVELSDTDFGHEALRFRMQQLARTTPREIAEASGREKWTLQTITALESAIRKVRETIGTKASGTQNAILDRMTQNLAAAKVSLTGQQPSALAKDQKLNPSDYKDDDIRVTVQSPVGHIPGYVQADSMKGGVNEWSSNPDELKSHGFDTPDSAELLKNLPQGRYTLAEAKRLLEQNKGKKSSTDAIDKLPPHAPGTVRLFNGSKGGSGISWSWWTSDPKKAASFGENVQYMDIPADKALQARQAAQKRGQGGNTFFVDDPSVRTAKPVGTVEPTVHDLDAGPGALRKGRGEEDQPELLLPPVEGTSERPTAGEMGALPSTPAPGAEAIAWDKPDAWRPISAADVKNPRTLESNLAKGARVSGENVSKTRRVVALEGKDGKVHLASAYPHGRSGVMVADPGRAQWSQRPHRQLSEILKDYKPVSTMLLSEPVSHFTRTFPNRAAFEQQLAGPARNIAENLRPYEAPKAATEPVAGVPTQESVSKPDAEAVFSHLGSQEFSSPDELGYAIGSAKGTANWNKISAFAARAVAREMSENPELSREEAAHQFLKKLYDTIKSNKSQDDFTKAAVKEWGETSSETPGGRGTQPAGAQPGALRKGVQEAEKESAKLNDAVGAAFSRRGTTQAIAATRDAADNEANISGDKAERQVQLESANRQNKTGKKEVLEAATAVRESGGDKAMLDKFLKQLDAAEVKAREQSKSRNWLRRAEGKKWLRSIDDMRAGVNYAKLHWEDPDLQRTTEAGASLLDDQYIIETESGRNLRHEENYVPHRYEGEFYNDGRITFGGIRLLGRQWRAQRSFPTHYDAIEAGPYLPATMDFSALVGHRVRQGMRQINKGRWVQSLKNLTDPESKSPVAVEPKQNADGKWSPPDNDHVLIDRNTGLPSSGDVVSKPIAVRKGYEDLMKQLNSQSHIQDWAPTRVALEVGQKFKHALFLGNTFHPFRLGYYATAIMGRKAGWKGGLTALEFDEKDLPRAVEAGIVSPADAKWATEKIPVRFGDRTVPTSRIDILDAYTKRGLNVGRIQDAIYKDLVAQWPVFGKFNKLVFDKFTRGLMAQSAVTDFEALNKRYPNTDARKLIDDSTRDINNFFGSIGRQGWIKSATMQDLARLFVLSPQWVEGLVKKEAGFAGRVANLPLHALGTGARKGLPPLGSLGGAMGRGLAFMFALTQVMNMMSRRQPTWKNPEDDHKWDAWIPDPTGRSPGIWFSPLSVFAELTNDLHRYAQTKPKFWDAVSQIGENKMGPYSRLGMILMTGQTPFGEKITSTPGVLKAAAEAVAPSPISMGTMTRSALSTVAPGMVSPPPPGAAERQMLANLGIKTEVAQTPAQRLHGLAGRFMQDNGLKRSTGFVEQPTDEASYAKFRSAIRNGDEKSSRSLLNELRKGRSDGDIIKSMKRWSEATFTGSKKNESRFIQSLTDEQLNTYYQTLDERTKLLDKFYDLLIQSESP